MLPGNCLVCALLIWLRYGGRIIRTRGRSNCHYAVRCRDGKRRQFKVRWPLLPWPFGVLLFIGHFEVSE